MSPIYSLVPRLFFFASCFNEPGLLKTWPGRITENDVCDQARPCDNYAWVIDKES